MLKPERTNVREQQPSTIKISVDEKEHGPNAARDKPAHAL
jgi:hypothetical protein